MNFFRNIDLAIFAIINERWTTPALDSFMIHATNQETGILIILAILVIFAVLGRRKGRIAAVSALLSFAVIDPLGHYVIKRIIARPRPCHLDIGRLLVSCGGGFAMPSLHSAASFGIFTAIVFHYGAKSAPLYLLALVVAYSRVYVGVHWPTDVLVGALYGTAVGLAFVAASKRIFFREKKTDEKAP
ncbi:MAG TPA: phosphatase PAP2 family protein [candidate division Zixibacteria bacterium]|nr:phosphatase PAP2 family protein [candidate division Zixibacteria bacterium]